MSILAANTLLLTSPHLVWVWPFVAILLAIALLPLIPKTHHWWESNRNKLLISLALSAAALAYYYTRAFGAHDQAPGIPTVVTVLHHALLDEYFPFMTLLFALYVCAGGIHVRGDFRATPLVNASILAIGGVLASVIGTTGASLLLIRLLLQTNAERRKVAHTVIFFIFIVSNCGGLLLPTGDPPLFLGYLRGVPFLWTLKLWREWAITLGLLLAIYCVWDFLAYRSETEIHRRRDTERVEPIRISGWINFIWLVCVVAAAALLSAGVPVPGTNWSPPPYFREGVQWSIAGLSLLTTPRGTRAANQFNYTAIAEVACLFIGIFITMQPPIEMLHALGPRLSELHFTHPWQYFWSTGLLSSFLDNAPTYVVFFETANQLTTAPGNGIIKLVTGEYIREDLLEAISLGAVFMGANTYIGNGPNFMVKSIAEQAGVRMPSFFGYLAYSGAILIPLFVGLTIVFFNH